jgi:hypothetical protein
MSNIIACLDRSVQTYLAWTDPAPETPAKISTCARYVFMAAAASALTACALHIFATSAAVAAAGTLCARVSVLGVSLAALLAYFAYVTAEGVSGDPFYLGIYRGTIAGLTIVPVILIGINAGLYVKGIVLSSR